MFEYQEATFYTEYFKKNDAFSVIEEFKVSEDKEEKNLYIGIVEVLNTIHPLILRVEIPFTFPHNKLVFRTKSLSGYPHLIHTGKIEHGDWFCLNTPFAETPEEQLNQEVSRLKEWISRQMRVDLPSIIKDNNVKMALAFANAYEWENLDEVKEFSSKALLTFVGDFHNDTDYFKNKTGYLNCIKTPDNRFYALADAARTNHRLPYIIVDQAPKSEEHLADFVLLMEQYEWDEKICEHLLPEFKISKSWRHCLCGVSYSSSKEEKQWEESEALLQLEQLEAELNKDDSYLFAAPYNGRFLDFNAINFKRTKVLPSQKQMILNEIYSLKEQVLEHHKYPLTTESSYIVGDVDNMTDEELEKRAIEAEREEFYLEIYPYEYHYFALGIKCDDGIVWQILYTNRVTAKCDKMSFDLVLDTYEIEKLVSHPLNRLNVQVVSEEMFFGRGSFSKNLKCRRVALVGLGAIGSMVATSLAHCGVSKFGLWDFDIVEPGNICRSTYTINNLGESKVHSIASILKSINPFIKTKDLCKHGHWHNKRFIGTSFYANVNYKSQEDAIKELDGYDLIIDCTGSNEMLHFLSYAASEVDIVSMCITNHANELLCITNKDGNPFELRKAYLSRIEQDTKNFYIEGSGCYSPTFLANNCDIASLVNLALRDLNLNMENGRLMHSTIYSHSERGIIADKIATYKLDGYDISLNISSETLYDAENLEDAPEGNIGYIFGSYSKEGKQIMITHIVEAMNATDILTDAFETSKGLIDYIGDYRYSTEIPNTYSQESFELIATKAEDESINTNNPLLAVRNPDGSITFFLYINNELVQFTSQS